MVDDYRDQLFHIRVTNCLPGKRPQDHLNGVGTVKLFLLLRAVPLILKARLGVPSILNRDDDRREDDSHRHDCQSNRPQRSPSLRCHGFIVPRRPVHRSRTPYNVRLHDLTNGLWATER
jgi:hypothetical protein